ncbi:MAG: caspase family protein, partial [Deltaproteobacteria bacterium]
MKITKKIKIALTCVFLLAFLPCLSIAAPEKRTALVIGNSDYEIGNLTNPVNDAVDMASTLKRLGFEVILKKNIRHRDMEEAIEDFGNRLKRGGVGLFYYAGHGIQINGVNYIIPIGAKIKKESDVKFEAVDANRILDEMGNANNGLNIIILDACRDNPLARNFRSSNRGLAVISSAPEGSFISYATGPGQVAMDGEKRNSPYTAALLKYMNVPGLPIERVFKNVRISLESLKQT